jgi:hypothetical protein
MAMTAASSASMAAFIGFWRKNSLTMQDIEEKELPKPL